MTARQPSSFWTVVQNELGWVRSPVLALLEGGRAQLEKSATFYTLERLVWEQFAQSNERAQRKPYSAVHWVMMRWLRFAERTT